MFGVFFDVTLQVLIDTKKLSKDSCRHFQDAKHWHLGTRLNGFTNQKDIILGPLKDCLCYMPYNTKFLILHPVLTGPCRIFPHPIIFQESRVDRNPIASEPDSAAKSLR